VTASNIDNQDQYCEHYFHLFQNPIDFTVQADKVDCLVNDVSFLRAHLCFPKYSPLIAGEVDVDPNVVVLDGFDEIEIMEVAEALVEDSCCGVVVVVVIDGFDEMGIVEVVELFVEDDWRGVNVVVADEFDEAEIVEVLVEAVVVDDDKGVMFKEIFNPGLHASSNSAKVP